MLPFSPVKSFPKIPVKGLITAFGDHHHLVTCGDGDYQTNDAARFDPAGLWSEVDV